MRCCLFGLVILASPTIAAAQDASIGDAPAGSATAWQAALVEVIARCEASVVAIARRSPDRQSPMLEGLREDAFIQQFRTARADDPQAMGTGVIIDPAGIILTQSLLVDKTVAHTVTLTDGRSLPATIRAADPRSGLAVLEVQATGLPAIDMGDADGLRKGQFVAAIGNPYAIVADGSPSCSWGIVSNLAQKAGSQVNLNNTPGRNNDFRSTLHHLGTLIQTDAKLTFSTGGGALVDLDGNMIGLTTSAAVIAGHEQPAGYAIPMTSTFRRIIEILAEGREVEYGLLGISLGNSLPRFDSPRTDEAQPSGVRVQGVVSGGPADLAGIERDDLITHVDGDPVPTSDRLQLVVGAAAPSKQITVRFQRQGQSRSAQVKLAKYPVEGDIVYTKQRAAWRGIHVDYATAAGAERLTSQLGSVLPDPEGCVLVRGVKKESPAWRAGVRSGMFISHVGDQRVVTPEEFHAAVVGREGAVRIVIAQTPAGQRNRQERQIPPEP